ASGELALFQSLVEDYEREFNVRAVEIAAALAKMARGGVALLTDPPQPGRRPAPALGQDREVQRGERPARQGCAVRGDGGGRGARRRPSARIANSSGASALPARGSPIVVTAVTAATARSVRRSRRRNARSATRRWACRPIASRWVTTTASSRATSSAPWPTRP